MDICSKHLQVSGVIRVIKLPQLNISEGGLDCLAAGVTGFNIIFQCSDITRLERC